LRVVLARLHQIHPAAEAGVTRKRMQNLRADLKRAFKVVGWTEGQNKKCWLLLASGVMKSPGMAVN
jgi:hypothetical protein